MKVLKRMLLWRFQVYLDVHITNAVGVERDKGGEREEEASVTFWGWDKERERTNIDKESRIRKGEIIREHGKRGEEKEKEKGKRM